MQCNVFDAWVTPQTHGHEARCYKKKDLFYLKKWGWNGFKREEAKKGKENSEGVHMRVWKQCSVSCKHKTMAAGRVKEKWARVGNGSCILPQSAFLANWPIGSFQLSLGAAIDGLQGDLM